jgi:hypothetical protein
MEQSHAKKQVTSMTDVEKMVNHVGLARLPNKTSEKVTNNWNNQRVDSLKHYQPLST